VHEGRQRDPGYFSNRCGPVNPVFIGKKVVSVRESRIDAELRDEDC
jgi:hypothetical protein